jgi:hypothetical protein
MIGMDSNHCRIITESLTGKRKVDERTFKALDELYERLERVQKLGDSFAGISFSPDVMKLQSRAVAVS